MIFALKNKEKITASPNLSAICPLCNKKVISKCGKIKIWHWSHKKGVDCDPFGESETRWHIDWKNEFPKEQQEILIKNHRADIKTNKIIIELQNSPLSPKKIIERENFYKNMIWLLNGKIIAKGINLREKNGIITFRWKNPPKSWWFAKKPIYIDFKDTQKKIFVYNKELYYPTLRKITKKIFLIKKIYKNIPCGGWGEMISKEDFIKRFK